MRRPDGVTNEHCRAIGEIIIQWGVIETLLRNMIADLCSGESRYDASDTALEIVLNGMEVRLILGLSKSLVKYRYPKDIEEFERLVKRLEKLYGKRNLIAHGLWTKGDKPNSIRTLRVLTVGAVRMQPREYTIEESDGVATRIWECGRDLTTFLRNKGLLSKEEERSYQTSREK